MIENVSTQLTVFHCLCPLPASRKGLRLTLRSALFGEGGRDWRPCITVSLFEFHCKPASRVGPNWSSLKCHKRLPTQFDLHMCY